MPAVSSMSYSNVAAPVGTNNVGRPGGHRMLRVRRFAAGTNAHGTHRTPAQ